MKEKQQQQWTLQYNINMNILKSRKCVYLFIFKKLSSFWLSWTIDHLLWQEPAELQLPLVSGSFLQFASADTAASLPLSAFGLQMWPDVLSDRDDSMREGRGDGAGTDGGGDDAPCHLPSTEELLLLETAFPKVPKRDRTLVPERKVLKSQENLNVHFIL